MKRYFGEPIKAIRVSTGMMTENWHCPAEQIQRHRHDRPYFSFVVAGWYRETRAGNSNSYAPGTLIWHPPNEEHENTFGPRGGIVFTFETGRQEASFGATVFDRGSLASCLAFRLYGAFHSGLSPANLIDCLIAQLSGIPEGTGKNHPHWLNTLLRHVDDHLDTDLSLDGVANILGLHPSHLARSFRFVAGVTLGEFVMGRRVEQACALLTSNQKPSDVAVAVGFCDQSHMTKHFKNRLAVTPSEFARTRQNMLVCAPRNSRTRPATP